MAVPKELPECPAGAAGLVLVYPFFCALGVPRVLVYIGGTRLAPDAFSHLDQMFAIVVVAHPEPYFTIDSSLATSTALNVLAAFDSFQGHLPSEMGNLGDLQLWFTKASPLTGSIPTQTGTMTDLTVFVTSHTWLTGSIPSQIFSLPSLETLDVSVAIFSGSIPTEIGRASSLEEFVVERNNLTGPIPSQIGLATNLRVFFASDNQFRSKLPTQLGRLSLLVLLDCAHCELRGALPSELGATALTSLDVPGNDLSGTVPTQLGRLTRLVRLGLGENSLDGLLPTQLAGLTALTELTLRSNLFSGAFPNLWAPGLQVLLLDDNRLSGLLPARLLAVPTMNCSASGLENDVCKSADPRFVGKSTFLVIAVISGVVSLATVGVGGVVVHYRGERTIRAINPRLSLVSLFGLLLVVLTVPLLGVATLDLSWGVRTTACRAIPHVFGFGIVLVLSTTFARNFPIWRIFDNQELKQVRYTFVHLIRFVLAAVLVNALFAVPLSLQVEAKAEFGCVVRADESVVVAQVLYFAFLAALACYVCYKIRNVPSEYNDTQNLVKATYLLATFGTALAILATVATEPQPYFLSISLCLILCVMSFVVIVFGPKLTLIYFPRVSLATRPVAFFVAQGSSHPTPLALQRDGTNQSAHEMQPITARAGGETRHEVSTARS